MPKPAETDKAVARIDAEIAEVRRLKLRPAAEQAAIKELQTERAVLAAKAKGQATPAIREARRMIEALPDFARRYRQKVQEALRTVADKTHIEEAREATRRLIEGGLIQLTPNADHTALTDPVHLRRLGARALEIAARRRNVQNVGSGGRI